MNRLLHPSLLFTLLLFLLLLSQTAAALATGEIVGKVLWIHDGDTLEVDTVGKVRLLGIDTPEREDSQRDDFLRRRGVAPARLRAIARAALQFNIETAKGKTVRLSFDGERRDRHGRLLAYVTLPDGRLLNRLLLEQGYAVVYRRFDFRLKEDFRAAEEEARKRKVGVWAK